MTRNFGIFQLHMFHFCLSFFFILLQLKYVMNAFLQQVLQLLEGENDHIQHLGEQFASHYTK